MLDRIKSLAFGSILTEGLSLGIVVIDRDYRIILWNNWMQRNTGVREGDILGQNLFQRYPDIRDSGKHEYIIDCVENRKPVFLSPFFHDYLIPIEIVKGSETIKMYQNVKIYPVFDAEETLGAVIVIEDMTEQIHQEREILKLNHILRAIRDVNQLIARTESEEELLKGACEIMVHGTDYSFAWIGFVEEGHLRPVCHAGIDDKIFADLKARWDDFEHKLDASSEVIKTGKTQVFNHIQKDHPCRLWWESANISGFLSVCSLPLEAYGSVVGTLTLYSEKPNFFYGEELELLEEVTGDISFAIESLRERQKRQQAEEMLHKALQESQWRQTEISALLEGSRAVLEHRGLPDAARAIFDSCKNLIGATGGYIALLSADETENEVLLLDTGGFSCYVDPSLSMPIRGLRGEVYSAGQVMYENNFSESKWPQYMPEGHVELDNVLFAPLTIEGRVAGLMGLANKPGEFNENDAQLASAFSEFAAIALRNSQALESLEDSEQRFRSVVQTANDAIVAIDSLGEIVFWSLGAETAFGYSVDEAMGKPITFVMPERFHKAHRRGMDRVLSTGKSDIIGKRVEVVGLRKDGSEFPIELSLALWKAKDETFFTAIMRDITDRKEEEARRVAEQERERHRVLSMRSDRLRSLGEMAAGIAHELNQPLQGVRGMAERLLISLDREWELTEETIRDRAGTIIEQADRMVNIIEHVRIFARESGKPELRPVKVNDVVRAGMDLLGTQLRSRGIQLDRELMESLPVISANPFSLEEVVINLLINARDAVEEQMKTGSVSTPPRILLRTLLDQTGESEWVKIEVIDNGIGIPEDIVEYVFDPFFTTKGPDRGTGLGLSISRSIVEGFGGTIYINSTFGSGTTATISLPVEQSRSQEEQ
jgi:PAS domain S-box-containing protein